MHYPLTSFIAWRYLRAHRQNRFASFISTASVLGIALGVGVLIIVLSVMNGFQKEVIKHVVGMTAHATIFTPGYAMENWQSSIDRLMTDDRVTGVAPFIRAGGMLNHRGNVRGIIIQGVDPEREGTVSDLPRYIRDGSLQKLHAGHNQVILGSALADDLDAKVGDTVSLVVPQWDARLGTLMPEYYRVKIAGLFKVGMHEFDAGFAITHLSDAAEFFDFGTGVSGLRIRFNDVNAAPLIAREISQNLDPNLTTIDWTQYHRNFFHALQSQKRIMFIILTLMIAVAAFNIVATMIMVVTEKQRDIAVLRTLGMTPHTIMRVFIYQGVLIGVAGSLLGILFGVWAASQTEWFVQIIEQYFHIQFIKPDVYFIDYLPSDIHIVDVIAVSGIAFVMSVLATLYPAFRAAKVNPAEALSYD